MTADLVENDYVVDALRHAIADGEHGLAAAPKALRRLIEIDAWRKRTIVRTGETAEFDSFRTFVTTPPLEGLGTTIETLRVVCGDDPVVLEMLDEPLNKPGEVGRGRPTNRVDIRNSKGGTGEDYTRRRLRRDRPDLYQQVLTGELSANAAAQQAGFRHPTATIRTDTPNNAIRGLLKRFTHHELQTALDATKDHR